jgi:hypothetical protein
MLVPKDFLAFVDSREHQLIKLLCRCFLSLEFGDPEASTPFAFFGKYIEVTPHSRLLAACLR